MKSTKQKFFFAATVTATCLLIIEGTSSWILSLKNLAATPQRIYAESISTVFDKEIGWVGKKSFNHKNFYGSNLSLTTNEHGHRIGYQAPSNNNTICCLGDSFALGFGVSNENTWVHRLGYYLKRSTINLGQGGYGPDQAWQLYKRHQDIDHRLVLFTFIIPDLLRMRHNAFNLQSRPQWEFKDGNMVQSNFPLEKYSSFENPLRTLATSKLINKILKTSPTLVSHEHNLNVMTYVLNDLQRRCNKDGKKLIVCLLPWAGSNNLADGFAYGESIQKYCSNENITYFNLDEEYQMLTLKDLSKFFIKKGESAYAGGTGHYTEFGNDAVAKWIAHRIKKELSSFQ